MVTGKVKIYSMGQQVRNSGRASPQIQSQGHLLAWDFCLEEYSLLFIQGFT